MGAPSGGRAGPPQPRGAAHAFILDDIVVAHKAPHRTEHEQPGRAAAEHEGDATYGIERGEYPRLVGDVKDVLTELITMIKESATRPDAGALADCAARGTDPLPVRAAFRSVSAIQKSRCASIAALTTLTCSRESASSSNTLTSMPL